MNSIDIKILLSESFDEGEEDPSAPFFPSSVAQGKSHFFLAQKTFRRIETEVDKLSWLLT